MKKKVQRTNKETEMNQMVLRVPNSHLLSNLKAISTAKQIEEHEYCQFAVYPIDRINYNIFKNYCREVLQKDFSPQNFQDLRTPASRAREKKAEHPLSSPTTD